MTRHTRDQFLRFVAAGLVNTVVTYGIYLVLVPHMHYLVAYSITYAIGIALSFVLNTRFVFGVETTWRRMTLFPLVYVVQYLTGAVALHVCVAAFGMRRDVAMAVAIACSVPMTFFAGKLVLTHKWMQRNRA